MSRFALYREPVPLEHAEHPPFRLTAVAGEDAPVVMIDSGCPGCSETAADPPRESEGEPAPRPVELGLLQAMTAKLTRAGGQTLAPDGLLSVDAARLQALPDAPVLEMHRNGMPGRVHAHLRSPGNMQALVGHTARRMQPAAVH